MRFVAIDQTGQPVPAPKLDREQGLLTEAALAGDDPECIESWLQSLLPVAAVACRVYGADGALLDVVAVDPARSKLAAREGNAAERYVP